ncbi:MATE family efflux transporter [Treponema lecithinolyticum]|uniref:Multidrug export protein MepA n=1 Tax=Treponema lecithinolyticum ATCC 700332 TaxID=1321815 RepID=A0ABN0NYP7_TRELE|nr:MATE family efflux transporter [Treponema lecithinolyticum]ERJ93103.1 MATE efflux family protein [Treponema lecithinolyticum ATCC 700332]
MNKEQQKEFILNGNLWKVLFDLSWPAVIAMVLIGMNNMVDAIFIGRFVENAKAAVAGISLAYPLTMIALGLGSLIGVGAGSLLSIVLGAKDEETQKKLIGNVHYLTVVISIAVTVLGVLFTDKLLYIMGGRGDALIQGTAYLKTTFYGSFFWIYGLGANMIVRAEGKMKTAAVIMAIGLVVNAAANYVLIVLLGMGVTGAAIGTNIGMAVYSLAGIIYFASGKTSFHCKAFSINRDGKIVKQIVSMGMPSLIMNVMFIISGAFVFNALEATGGEEAVALYGVAFRYFNFLLTPIYGLMRALQPVTGINFGAGRNDRVIQSFKRFWLIATALIVPFWLFLMGIPEGAIHLMLKEITVTPEHIRFFRVFVLVLPLMPAVFMGMTFFPSINKGSVASVIAILRQVLLYIPAMLIVPRFFGLAGIYYAIFCIEILCIAGMLVMVKREFRLLRTGVTKWTANTNG